MGVLQNNRRKVLFTPLSGGETTGASSEDEGPLNNIPTIVVPEPPRRPRPPPSPATNRRAPLAGTSLKLKKGRRARHRYDSERSLFAFGDIDPEEAPEGWDIAQENNSNFRTLLDNQELLDQFLDNEDQIVDDDDLTHPEDEYQHENRDPETSFLRISGHLRQVLKKHLPWGLLENLEEQIIKHFERKPQECFIASDFSSYERLLAHTCCMYNHLHSQSFDDEGIRKLKVSNPRRSHFQPIDPTLCEYLRKRNEFK